MLDVLPDKCLIGMVHLLPSPGSPRWSGDLAAVFSRAVADARALEQGGMDALLVENFGDAPFAKGPVEPITIATMALAIAAVRRAVQVPVGVNVLRNDARVALDLAFATGARFIRVNVLSGAFVTDQGVLEGDAYSLLRRRHALAAGVRIFADVLVKHAVPLGEVSLERAAADLANRALADALVVTGEATGTPASPNDVASVKRAVPDHPVLAGSGVGPATVRDLLAVADGVIVGTALKREGRVENEVDLARARALVHAARG